MLEIGLGQHLRLYPIVSVMSQVCNLVGKVHDLSFKARIQKSVELLRRRPIFECRVLDDPFPDLVREIQAPKPRVPYFDPVNRSKALRIVVEAAVWPHQIVQYPFASMTEGRMAQVMSQCDGFGQIHVQAQDASHCACNLGGFKRMGQSSAIVIALMVYEHLGFVLQAAKGGRMYNSIPITLKGRPHRMSRFRKASAAAITRAHSIGSQGLLLEPLPIFSSPQHLPVSYSVTGFADPI